MVVATTVKVEGVSNFTCVHISISPLMKREQQLTRSGSGVQDECSQQTKSRWEDMKVMANTDSCMVALYTTCDLNITRLPTPHVNKQHSPPHHSWNSHTVQPGHPPRQSAHYWMLAKQVSDRPAGSGDSYTVGDGGECKDDRSLHNIRTKHELYKTEVPNFNPPSCTACKTFGETASKALMGQPTAHLVTNSGV